MTARVLRVVPVIADGRHAPVIVFSSITRYSLSIYLRRVISWSNSAASCKSILIHIAEIYRDHVAICFTFQKDFSSVMELAQANGHNLQDGVAPRQKERVEITNNADPQPKVHQLLRSMINSLALMGMYFHVRRRQGSPCPRMLRRYGCIIYSTLVMLFVSAFVLHVQHTRIGGDTSLVNWIKRGVWDMHSLCHFVVFYAMSVKLCLPRLLDKWQRYREAYNTTAGSISRKSTICAVILWFLTTINVGGDAYMTYSSYVLTTTQEDRSSTHLAFLVLVKVLVDAYTVFAWLGSSILVLLVCILLVDEFESINKEIKALIKGKSEDFCKGISDIRCRHWELCAIVRKADDSLTVHVGLGIFASLALSCLSLYLIIWDPVVSGDSTMSAITAIWMLLALVKMTTDCVSGILINNAVSDVEDITFRGIINLFIHNVTINNPSASFFISSYPNSRDIYCILPCIFSLTVDIYVTMRFIPQGSIDKNAT